MESLTVENMSGDHQVIPAKEKIEIRIKALCLKLILCPENFTLIELGELHQHMEKEGLIDP